jgi:murein DD-endopeptidase / murein LD-carboxypeptidase
MNYPMYLTIRRLLYGLATAIAVCICYKSSTAQVDTIDYSYLKFGSLYDYYTAKEVDIVAAQHYDLYFEVFDWLGTPYVYGGKSKRGIDCSAFVAQVYKRIYGKALSGAVSDIFNKCLEVDESQLNEGDFVIFNIGGRYLSHIGVYLQNRRFAHATVHGGVMVNSLDEPYYKRYYYKSARLIEP